MSCLWRVSQVDFASIASTGFRTRVALFEGEIAAPITAMRKVGVGEHEDRTPRRTRIFLCLVSVPHLIALFTLTCVRVAQVKLVT